MIASEERFRPMIVEPQAVDVIDLIDAHPVTGYQIGILVLCMLVGLLDGYDTQAIGFTAPAMIAALKLPMAQFGRVGAAALFGGAIGALAFGPLADRLGRKWFMILATLVFAVFAYMTAEAQSLNELLAYRFLSGLGFGGAMPTSIALGAELAPRRLREVFVTILSATFPAGGLVGSIAAAWVLPQFGWKTVFYIGAAAPLLLAVALAIWLPESVRFLILRNKRPDAVRRTVERITRRTLRADTQFRPERGSVIAGAPLVALFADGRALPTVLLWVPYFMVFLVLITVTFWTPTLLTGIGYSASAAALIGGISNFGSAFSSPISGWAVHRFNPYRVLALAFIGGGLCLTLFGQAAESGVALSVLAFVEGVFMGGATVGLIAIAVDMYPTAVRSTGIGTALGMGRIGQIFGPLLAGVIVGQGYTLTAFFSFFALPCFIGALFMLFIAMAVQRARRSSLAEPEPAPQ